jgi:hypothetical protein
VTRARGWGQANGWKGGELQRLEHVSGSIYSGEGAATYLQVLIMFRFEAYLGSIPCGRHSSQGCLAHSNDSIKGPGVQAPALPLRHS